MYRKVLKDIEKWYGKPNFKPLLLNGARQVGKTWLMFEFARKFCPENYIYVNFEEETQLKDLFATNFDIQRINSVLSIAKNHAIDNDTLFLFDELQSATRGLTALKYLHEKCPTRRIIAAGSLLGLSLHEGDSFPVGKVELLDVFPLTFNEFLMATGNAALEEAISAGEWQIIEPFKLKIEALLKQYYFVGGMPEVVEAFVKTDDMAEVRELQTNLLRNYEYDFSKHAPSRDVPRIRMVWQSISSQLAKENRKFVYGQVRDGARARDFESAIRWLQDAGLIRLVHRITNPELPLKAFEELDVFKIFMLDVGLLGALSGLGAEAIIDGSSIFSIFKGALTEQYVCQQLTAAGKPLYYWSANNSQAEVDFITEQSGKIVPIEVKSSVNLQSKSLKAFCNRYGINESIRFSLNGFMEQANITNIPLWAVNTFLTRQWTKR